MASLQSQTQTVHRSVKSLDFLSNKIKSRILPSTNLEVNLDLPSPSPRNLKYTKNPIHPFLRPTEVQRVSGVCGELKRFYRFSPYETKNKDGELVYHSKFLDADSTEESLWFLNKYKPFKELSRVHRSAVKTRIENVDGIAAAKLQAKFASHEYASIIEDQIYNGDGIQVDVESKARFVIKNNIESEPRYTSAFVKEYISNIENQRSSKDIFLYYLKLIIDTSCSFPRRSVFKTYSETLSTNYPSLKSDPEIIETLIDTLSRAGRSAMRQKQLLLLLEELDLVPSKEIVERFLLCIVKELGDVRSRHSFIMLVKGLDNVIYSSLSPKVAEVLVNYVETHDEIIGFLQLLDSRADSANIYNLISDKLATKVLNDDSDIALTVALFQKLELSAPLSHESYVLLIKKLIDQGSLIYVSSLIQKHELSTSEKSQLLDALEKRSVVEGFHPGFDEHTKDLVKKLLG